MDRRTATSKTFATDRAGEFVTELSATPVHYKADGTWKEIDPTLALAKDGRLHNKGAAFDLSVATDASDAAVARLGLDAGHSVGFALEGAAKVKGATSADASSYAGARKDTSLRLTSRSTGLKEELVLASPAAPDRFVFPLQLKGLTASIDAAGNVIYRDEAGIERARTPHGYMYDSRVDPQSDEPAASLGVTFALIPYGKGGTALVVTLDRAWLNDAARQYPVVVDPEFVANTGADDTYVMRNFTRDNSSDPELKVGTYDGSVHIGRSYLHFNTAPIANKVIQWGRLDIAESHSWNCGAAGPTPYRVVQGWNGRTMTGWPGAAIDVPAGGVLNPTGGTCPNRTFSADMNGASANWASGAWNNLGIALVAPNEGDNNYYKKFKSLETGAPPALHVGWTEPATVPSAPQNLVATARNLSATVSWAPPANNGGAAVDNYVAYAYSYPSGAYANSYAFACGTCTTATLTGLTNGQQYYFTVHAHNAVNWGAPGVSNVVVPTPQPPGPPGNPSATPRNQSATVSWTAPGDNGGAAIQFYGVFAYSYPSYTYLSYTQGCATCTSLSVPNLTNGQQYIFGIYAYNGVNWGAGVGTNVVAPAVTTPNAPASVIASPGDTSATIAWSAPTDNGGAAITSSWVLAYTTSPSLAYANKYVQVCATCTSGTVTGLTNGVSYQFLALATNSVGNGAYTWSNAVVPGSAPNLLAPTTVMASRGDKQATITWTRPGLRLEGITTYVVKVFVESDLATVVASTTVTDPAATAVVPGLTNGTRYVATVTASTALLINVTSSASAPFVPAGSPLAATNVVAMMGDARAFVAWDPADGNGAAVTRYTVKASPGNITTSVEGTPPPTKATVQGLTNGTAYTFTVSATNEVSTGTASGASQPITPQAAFTPSTQHTPVANGAQHSLVINSDGTVFAWGMNTYGQLGNGTTQDSGAGLEVPGLTGVVSVAAGDRHSLALRSDGTVWAWGDNGQRQLGVPSNTSPTSTSPVQVPGLTGVMSIAAGAEHSMAVRSDGTVWSWGANGSGQLGTTPTEPSVQEVPGVRGVNKVVGAGTYSMALAADGSVWAWGDNSSGQTGGSSPSSVTPAPIPGLSGIRSLAAGRFHAMAVASDGSLWAWGSNGSGQLGVGDTQPRNGAVRVQGVNAPVAISGGDRHSLALMPDGSSWAWGANDISQLGIGPSTVDPSTLPVQVLREGGGTLANGRLIVGGGNQSLVVDSNGIVWEFGQHFALADSKCIVATTKTKTKLTTKVAIAAAVVAILKGVTQNDNPRKRFVADTGIFTDRPGGPTCRATVDAAVFNLPITLVVPEQVDRELALSPSPGQSARRSGQLGIADVQQPPIPDGVVTPAQTAMATGKFTVADMRIVNAARRDGLVLLTTNYSMIDQILSGSTALQQEFGPFVRSGGIIAVCGSD